VLAKANLYTVADLGGMRPHPPQANLNSYSRPAGVRYSVVRKCFAAHPGEQKKGHQNFFRSIRIPLAKILDSPLPVHKTNQKMAV
jgi:hypothetical protein